ncbi:MAG: hypothetical protein PHO89_08235 [Methylacidiphilaceae bacterium]|nr:hypothetical protein [Candidatus Methylacidiphilaceae bacterium]
MTIEREGGAASPLGSPEKSLGAQGIEALTGIPGQASLSGAMGTTFFLRLGLWASSPQARKAWGPFSKALAGPSEHCASSGLRIAAGEPLRFMVGAARTLSEEEEPIEGVEELSGPDEGPGPFLILYA